MAAIIKKHGLITFCNEIYGSLFLPKNEKWHFITKICEIVLNSLFDLIVAGLNYAMFSSYSMVC